MILNIYFEKTSKVIPFNNQHQMNGVIASILGENNKYHDSFSTYSISSIQGGIANEDKTGLVFPNEPYIQVASEDDNFINDFVQGIYDAISNETSNFFGLHITHFTDSEFKVKSEFDVVKTISPILIKKNNKKINCTDSNWLEMVNENCRMKLSHLGIKDDSFKIEIKNPGNVKTKMVWVGEIFNPCTSCVMTVHGKKETRTTLYNLGIGNSTGSGFGAVKILEKN